MNISTGDLYAECDRALAAWPFLWEVEAAHGLPRGLLLAVGSRETNLRDVVGDGGHGHGVFQLDDRSHTIPNPFTVQAQANTAADMLANGYVRCHSWQGSAAIYNSGQPNDAHTTGGNYGADVMGRCAAIAAHYPTTPTTSSYTPQEGDMIADDPISGGLWVTRPDGSVFCYDGAPYLGGLNNHPDWHAGTGHGPPCVGIAFCKANGGYYLVTDNGKDTPSLYRMPRDGSLAATG